jgi:hypothetical protein
MSDSNSSNGIPSLNYFFFGVASVIVILVVSKLSIGSTRPEVDVEAKRGVHRTEVRAKLRSEEDAKLNVTEWINKGADTARIPLGDAVKLTAKELSQKAPKASEVKVDPQMPMPAGAAPAMPSAPGGARTTQFPKISTSSAQ